MSVAENVMSGRHIKSNQKLWHGIFHTPASRQDETENWQVVFDLLDFFDLEQFAESDRVGSLPTVFNAGSRLPEPWLSIHRC